MNWSDVGNWLKANAGSGAALVGSLLTGNVPGAIAAGISIVSGATGTDDPAKALAQFQGNPEALIRLKEIAQKEEESIRAHIRGMKELELNDLQAEQKETQETIRAGDKADDPFVRFTRPGQSWLSLFGALAYTFLNKDPSFEILALLLSLPWAYAGLRQIGKGMDMLTSRKKV